ncbi:MAG: DUF2786 domain-containing protein, partial [Acidimicrobiales bacterium]
GDQAAFEESLAWLAAGPPVPGGQRQVDMEIGRVLLMAVRDAWRGGWQPVDVTRFVGRELRTAHARLAGRAVLVEARSSAGAARHPRWQAQLDDLASPTTDVGVDDRWAVAAAGTDRPAAIRLAIETLSVLVHLPQLPKLGPAPGEPMAGSRSSGSSVDERILTRVRALLAKAESTTFPDEAASLTAKAQQLMARHAIDHAVVADRSGTGPAIEGRRVPTDDPYAPAKAMLVDAIASANRCRAMWSKGVGFSTLFGDALDLDTVELLYTSLLVQATSAMVTARPRGARRGTRRFRQSFLVAFAGRIGARLRDANVATVAEAEADHGVSLLPVLVAQSDAADEACEAAFPDSTTFSLAANDHAGRLAGTLAAEMADLTLFDEVEARSATA